VGLDELFEIVNVDELDVKLVVEMFYFGELFFGEGSVCELLELVLASVEVIALGTECVSPATAFPSQLRDVCLYHGAFIFGVIKSGFRPINCFPWSDCVDTIYLKNKK